MVRYDKENNHKTSNFPVITNAPFDINVDFYVSLKNFNNCSKFQLFSMQYCTDHQKCKNSYKNLDKNFFIKMKERNLEKNQNQKKKLQVPRTIQKESDSSNCQDFFMDTSKKLPIIILIISLIK